MIHANAMCLTKFAKRRTIAQRLLVLLVAVAATTAAALPARAAIAYKLNATDGAAKSFAVTLRLTELDPAAAAIELRLPAWTPGYYQLVDYARGVSDFAATDAANGRELKWSSDEPSAWRIETADATTIEVRYRVRTSRQFVAESWLDDSYGYACPAGVFMYQDRQLGQPAEVELELPLAWKSATGLTAIADKPHAYRAANFDELYDCPILMGPLESIEFVVAGKPHAFVACELGDFDREEFIRDMTAMITSAAAIVDDMPYDRYQFLGIGPGPGGIEHMNTSAVGYTPTNGRSPTRNRRTLNFWTHEYFHLFNAKRIRPVELGPFDYSGPNRTRMLWVAEGFTVYYEHLILKRAGLVDRGAVLDSLASAIWSYESRPGRLVQSAADASWNTWSDGPFGGDPKTTVNCYTKGAALGALIDFAIRHATDNQKSLDDAMRILYREYHVKQHRGYTEGEFRAACERVAGQPLAEVLDYSSTTQEIDYAKYLGYAGLQLELPPREGEANSENDDAEEEERREPRIIPVENPTPQQQAILHAWLGE